MRVVAISGGFDPIHVGHIRLIQEAAKLGDELVVIVNNDNWISKKKGKPFMHEDDRMEILRSIEGVTRVVLTSHEKGAKDNSVCKELKLVRPTIFANGGDRFRRNTPEQQLCDELGIITYYRIGGKKIRSSSKLLKAYAG